MSESKAGSSRRLYLGTAIVAAAIGLGGCETNSGGTAPESRPGKPVAKIHKGFGYHLARHQLVLETVVTSRAVNRIKSDLTVDTKVQNFRYASVDATPRLVLVPETSETYYFTPPSSSFADQDFTVAASKLGVLTSVNGTSTGKAGEALTSIAKIVGTIAPLVGFLGVEKDVIDSKILNANNKPDFNFSPDEEAYARRWLSGAEPVEGLYISKEQRARSVWADLMKIELKLKVLREAHLKAVDAAQAASTEDEIKKADSKLSRTKANIASLDERRVVLQSLFATGVDAFKIKEEIGPRTLQYKNVAVLELSEIPTWSERLGGQSQATIQNALSCASGAAQQAGDAAKGKSSAFDTETPEAAATPTGAPSEDFGWCTGGVPRFPKAAKLFQDTRLLVTVSPYENGTTAALPASEAGSGSQILYRRPALTNLSYFVMKEAAPATDNSKNSHETRLVLDGTSEVALVYPNAPIASIAMTSGAWSSAGVTLALEDGALTSAQQSKGAVVSGALQSTANALPAVFTQAQTTVTAVNAIAAARRSEELSRLRDQVAIAGQQKALIDAQILRDGVNANKDLVVEQQRLTAELATYNARIGLANAQSAQDIKVVTDANNLLTAQRNLAAGTATYDLQLQQSIMAQELAALNSRYTLDSRIEEIESGVQRKIDDLTRQLNLLTAEINLQRKQLEAAGAK